jgi:hypothetical protein
VGCQTSTPGRRQSNAGAVRKLVAEPLRTEPALGKANETHTAGGLRHTIDVVRTGTGPKGGRRKTGFVRRGPVKRAALSLHVGANIGSEPVRLLVINVVAKSKADTVLQRRLPETRISGGRSLIGLREE